MAYPAEVHNEICHLLRDGFSCRQVAEHVGVSLSMVGQHRAKMEILEDPYVDPDTAARKLWCSVIELAIKDLEAQSDLRSRDELARHSKAKLRNTECISDPRDFFASDWYREICQLLDLDPDAILSGVRDLGYDV